MTEKFFLLLLTVYSATSQPQPQVKYRNTNTQSQIQIQKYTTNDKQFLGKTHANEKYTSMGMRNVLLGGENPLQYNFEVQLKIKNFKNKLYKKCIFRRRKTLANQTHAGKTHSATGLKPWCVFVLGFVSIFVYVFVSIFVYVFVSCICLCICIHICFCIVGKTIRKGIHT